MIASLSNSVRLLATRWRQWRKVVRNVAKHRSARVSLDPVDYLLLHQELLRLVRQQQCTDPESHALWSELLTLLAPWVTLDALSWADRSLVTQVLAEADRLQSRIEGRTLRSLRCRERLLPALALAVLILLCTAGLSYRASGLTQDLTLDNVEHYYYFGRNLVAYCGQSELAWLLILEGVLFFPVFWFWNSRW